jgi:addiction module RelE/StbE family toxin
LNLVWRKTAIDDLTAIVFYISQANPIAGKQIAEKLSAAADSLLLFPKRGRAGRVAGTRELSIVRPYVPVYDIDNKGDINVLRIWHAAQSRLR